MSETVEFVGPSYRQNCLQNPRDRTIADYLNLRLVWNVIDLTWAEIEDLGHVLGKPTTNEIDQTIQRQQAEKFGSL